MKEAEVKVINKAGIHTRPAASIVKTAAKFKSEIYLERDNMTVNAKSIIMLMGLAAEYGAVIKIIAKGEDEDRAIEAMKYLFETGFNEL